MYGVCLPHPSTWVSLTGLIKLAIGLKLFRGIQRRAAGMGKGLEGEKCEE